MPLSPTDYIARFSLEFVVLGIAVLGVFANFSIKNRADNVGNDQSVIFSFLKNNPSLNEALLAKSNTTTVVAKSDQLIPTASASTSGIFLASSLTSTSAVSSDPTTIQDNVIIKTNPSDTDNFSRHGLTKYQVQSGDTLIGIASSFGISPSTIMQENKMNPTTTLKPGQELTILPTTGITYTLKDGDTLGSILNKYKVSEDDLLDANNLEVFEDLEVGAIVVIPMDNVTTPAAPKIASKFVRTESGKVSLKTADAPADLIGSAISFIWPTPVRTITQGFSSRHTGLDISNSKKEAISASSDGFVEISGWQTSYGNTIVINHGNGYKTRYAHTSELYVSAGDYVKQGQLIAKQGNTGRVRGTTGIHLHFEITKNGKRVNPLSYSRP